MPNACGARQLDPKLEYTPCARPSTWHSAGTDLSVLTLKPGSNEWYLLRIPQGDQLTLQTATDFPIVCLGGSAGVLQAYLDILSGLSPDTGMAFIIAQHRSPNKPELLSRILSRTTPMVVSDVEQGMQIVPNHIYVLPPRMELRIERDHCFLRVEPITGRWPRTINTLLCSLAATVGTRTVAVILSGMDSDGSAALKFVKEGGGRTFAQRDAIFDSMPRKAVLTGNVDHSLPAYGISKALNRLALDGAMMRKPLHGRHLFRA